MWPKGWGDFSTRFVERNVSFARQRILRCVFCVVAGLASLLIALSVQAAPETPDPVYIVRPGDTLPVLAARWGLDVTTLTTLNDLRDPRVIYSGQVLKLPSSLAAMSLTAHHVTLDDRLSVLAQRAGVSWEMLAAHNRQLNAGRLLVGQTLYIPELAPEIPQADIPQESYIATAVRHDTDYWPLRRLNPLPRYTGDSVLLPNAEPATEGLPYPLTDLHLAPQPALRGTTVMVTLTTSISATCETTFLDTVEACYAQSATKFVSFIGLSPLMETGNYTLTLFLTTLSKTLTLPLPLHVAPGRYDYERIDLPPDRQSLLDPDLSQAERDKIARLRLLRTPNRDWEYPFTWPVDASVTSYYGSRRSYGWGFTSYHAGTDFRGEIGTPILAPASGTVILAEPLVVRGNAILIDHGWGIVSGYWHLSRIEVTAGQIVTQGMQIGQLGNTGLSTGPHLHWEMWVNGSAVSPLQWLDPTLFVVEE